MKRFVVLLLALVMVFSLVGCGGGKTATCELCGKETKCKSLTFQGETGWFCNDCYDTAKALVNIANSLS